MSQLQHSGYFKEEIWINVCELKSLTCKFKFLTLKRTCNKKAVIFVDYMLKCIFFNVNYGVLI